MSFTYKTILDKAKECKNSVETEYKVGINTKNAYYFCKLILNPKSKSVEHKPMDTAPEPSGTAISNQIYKKDYLKLAEYLVEFVEHRNRLPNFLRWGNYRIRVRDYVYLFARILIYIDKNGAYPKYANINTKCWTKPTEYPTEILKYFQKKTGIKPTCIDDFCDWCKNKVDYEFYFDDKKSNKEVIDSKAGNCTDLSQLAVNIAEALGYDWVVYHVRCNQSGTGHVYPMFRKKGVNGGNWFARDVACIADESRYCIWCESGNGGSLIAKNPSWWLANLRR